MIMLILQINRPGLRFKALILKSSNYSEISIVFKSKRLLQIFPGVTYMTPFICFTPIQGGKKKIF